MHMRHMRHRGCGCGPLLMILLVIGGIALLGSMLYRSGYTAGITQAAAITAATANGESPVEAAATAGRHFRTARPPFGALFLLPLCAVAFAGFMFLAMLGGMKRHFMRRRWAHGPGPAGRTGHPHWKWHGWHEGGSQPGDRPDTDDWTVGPEKQPDDFT